MLGKGCVKFQSQARCNPLCDFAGYDIGIWPKRFQSQARCNPLCDMGYAKANLPEYKVSIPSEMQSPLRPQVTGPAASRLSVSIPSEMQSPLRLWKGSADGHVDSLFQSQARCNPLCDSMVRPLKLPHIWVSIPSEMQSPLRPYVMKS